MNNQRKDINHSIDTNETKSNETDNKKSRQTRRNTNDSTKTRPNTLEISHLREEIKE